MTFAEAAMIMMSGGKSAVIKPLTVTENGKYEAPDGVDGFNPIDVKVAGGGSADPKIDKIKQLPDIARIDIGSSAYSIHIKASYIDDDITIYPYYNFSAMVEEYEPGHYQVLPFISSLNTRVYLYFCLYSGTNIVTAVPDSYGNFTVRSYGTIGIPPTATYLSYYEYSTITNVRDVRLSCSSAAWTNTEFPIFEDITAFATVDFRYDGWYYDEKGNVIDTAGGTKQNTDLNARFNIEGVINSDAPFYYTEKPNDKVWIGNELIKFGNAVYAAYEADDIRITYP